MISVRAFEFLGGWIEDRLTLSPLMGPGHRIGAECLTAAEAAGLRASELGGCPERLGRVILDTVAAWNDSRAGRRPDDADDGPERAEIYVAPFLDEAAEAARPAPALRETA